MQEEEIKRIIVPILDFLEIPNPNIWYDYDIETDALYINLKKPSHRVDSEVIDNDIIIRYEKGELIGFIIFNASDNGRSRLEQVIEIELR